MVARRLGASRPSALPRAFSAKMRKDVRPREARPVRLTARGRFVSREAASNRARNPGSRSEKRCTGMHPSDRGR